MTMPNGQPIDQPSDQLTEQIDAVLRLVLGLPATPAPVAGIERAQTPQWDSLRHVELVLTLEERFGVRFDADEVGTLTCTDAIGALVAGKLAAHR